jgi:hypothetical protein
MSHVISRASDPAPIVHRTETEICFRVDDVDPCPERLPFTNARQQLENRLGRPLQAFTHDEAIDIVRSDGSTEHGLVHAVYLAFSQHRPLVLTPDVIWMTLAQGFAHHINNHAEALRSRIVAHKGKMALRVDTGKLATSQDWAGVIQKWSAGIQAHVPAELYQLMLCDFSTTTPTIRTASQVVMMDAFQQYFDYIVEFICGIPTVTVRGSVEDWVAIRKRVDVMTGYHLEWWTDRLIPICDGFIDTVQGNPSQNFWKHIFSPKEIYGGTCITGWLADLFPYIKDDVSKAPTVRNPVLNIPRDQLTSERGLSPADVPTGLSSAPVTLKDLSILATKEMELVAGFVGVKQDVAAGWLEPEIGWTVLEKDAYAQVLTRLASAASGKVAKTRSLSESPMRFPESAGRGVPKEFIQLMEEFEQGEQFYTDTTHPWVLRPYLQLALRQVSIPDLHMCEPGVHFMDLSDGRGIAYLYGDKMSQHWWIILGKPDGQEFQSGSVTVIAQGFKQFFQRLTAAEGCYYFDEPGFKPNIVT